MVKPFGEKTEDKCPKCGSKMTVMTGTDSVTCRECGNPFCYAIGQVPTVNEIVKSIDEKIKRLEE